ncbi:5-formyltetrahydrofolate cyclo-ligase [Marinilactibacillus kalidii]|uniref:5-formyltetrahydrofolate cyclo-ligase n=1 Tax=Marinilactibacillus kalidii TaxID=2820274 RepID=UPI001ABDD32D|nr:5-formyltetrahydrofolate cyclo-ligase [Marinilactibacillus kalidii]
MEKETIRAQVMNTLKSLSSTEKQLIEQAFYKTLFDSEHWKEATSIGVTLSGGLEWDTEPIIKQAWYEGKKVAVPKSIHATRALHFYEIDQFAQVKAGYFGIREPLVQETTRCAVETIDLMIVPGVVFTREGYRIGFGGGYYDRLLADFPNTTLSLVCSSQLVEEMPVEPHDIPVQYLIVGKTISTGQKHAIIEPIQPK